MKNIFKMSCFPKDGIIIENMHDIPYVKSNLIGPEIVSAMTRICSDVKRNLASDIPCGLQVWS